MWTLKLNTFYLRLSFCTVWPHQISLWKSVSQWLCPDCSWPTRPLASWNEVCLVRYQRSSASLLVLWNKQTLQRLTGQIHREMVSEVWHLNVTLQFWLLTADIRRSNSWSELRPVQFAMLNCIYCNMTWQSSCFYEPRHVLPLNLTFHLLGSKHNVVCMSTWLDCCHSERLLCTFLGVTPAAW